MVFPATLAIDPLMFACLLKVKKPAFINRLLRLLYPEEDILFIHVIEQRPNNQDASCYIHHIPEFAPQNCPAKYIFGDGTNINHIVKQIDKDGIHTNNSEEE